MAKTKTKTAVLEATTHIKDLVPDPNNRRKHNPRNIGLIVDALNAVGAARSIVIDEDNVLLSGNGTVEAAAEAGITKVQVVEADGNTLVAVRRTGLSPEQKRALALYDNRAAELAEWDAPQLQADLSADLDLKPYWSDAELSALFSRDAASAIRAMASAANGGGESAAGAGDGSAPEAATTGEQFQTFTCPLTTDQERMVRMALKKAKTIFQVETTGRALALALDAWANGQNQ